MLCKTLCLGILVFEFSYRTSQEITDEINTVVVKDPNDYVWPFLEQYIQVLVAPMQRSIDDILEAYMFKELHDLSF